MPRRRNPSVRAYHGTKHLGPADPPSFEPEREGRVWFSIGSPDGYPIQRTGVFFSGSRRFAKSFGSRVIECSLRMKKTARLDDDEEIVWRFADDVADWEKDRNFAIWASRVAPYAKKWELFDGDEGRRFVAWLKSKGYDSAAFKEYASDDDGKEVGGTTYVVFDKSQVRCLPRANPNPDNIVIEAGHPLKYGGRFPGEPFRLWIPASKGDAAKTTQYALWDRKRKHAKAFLDVFVTGSTVYIGYLFTDEPHRKKKHASRLVEALYAHEPWSKRDVNWGRLMDDASVHLYNSFRVLEPDRTCGGKFW